MKPEEFVRKFVKAAEELGYAKTPEGNIICQGGKNISPGKAEVIYKRYGMECVGCSKPEFPNDPKGLKTFRIIAQRVLG